VATDATYGSSSIAQCANNLNSNPPWSTLSCYLSQYASGYTVSTSLEASRHYWQANGAPGPNWCGPNYSTACGTGANQRQCWGCLYDFGPNNDSYNSPFAGPYQCAAPTAFIRFGPADEGNETGWAGGAPERR
jgi:hypothetical protein